MLKANCHCGQVHITVPRMPEHLTDCNCSVCRRYGVLWCYFPIREVQIEAAPGATQEYLRGSKQLRFGRCANCGCVMYWQGVGDTPDDKMAVNARCFDPPITAKSKSSSMTVRQSNSQNFMISSPCHRSSSPLFGCSVIQGDHAWR